MFSLRNSLLELLELNKPINSFGIPEKAIEKMGIGFLDDFHKRRINKKIHMRHIYSMDARERIDKLNKIQYTEAKSQTKKYDSIVSTNVCGDTVLFFVFSEPISVIKIKSELIANTYNNYFEILWKNSKYK